MPYLFYIDGVQLPITPPKLSLKVGNQNKNVTLINEGEVNVLKSPGLTEVKFEASFPQVRYPFASYPNGFKPADYYLAKLEALKFNKKPFQFVCSRSTPSGTLLFDTNMKVSLEDYEVIEDVKDGLDVSVNIKLLQYRQYGTKILTPSTAVLGATTATVSETRETATAPTVSTYTVVKGDCLWNIAKKILGKGSRYTEIFALNKDKITNPNKIAIGQILTMPAA